MEKFNELQTSQTDFWKIRYFEFKNGPFFTDKRYELAFYIYWAFT